MEKEFGKVEKQGVTFTYCYYFQVSLVQAK